MYAKYGIKINQDGKKRSAYEILGYKGVSWQMIQKIWPEIQNLELNKKIKRQIKINSFYNKYSDRQKHEIHELEKDNLLKLSKNLNYNKCQGYQTK